MKKHVILFLLFVTLTVFSQSVKEMFSEAIVDWARGDIDSAIQKIEEIFYKPIPAEDLAEFWYLRAKLMIETGRVREAYEDLKNLLVIVPNQPEALSLVHNLEFILRNEKVGSFYMKTLRILDGFKNGVEYFFSPTDVAVLGKNIYIVDPPNNRLIETDGYTYKVKKLSFRPEQVFVDKDGNIFLISEDGDVYRNEKKIGTFLHPIGAGVLNSGEFVVADVNKIVLMKNNGVKEIPLSGNPLIMDAEVYRRQVIVLDVWSNSLIATDVDSGEQQRISLPVPARSFEMFYDGSYLLLDQFGVLYHFDGRRLQKIGSIPQYVNMEYDYPYLFGTDWKNHRVEISILKSSEPVFVHIDSFEFTTDRMSLYVRVEDAFGRDIDLVHIFSDLLEARGRVPFEVSYRMREYTTYISDEEFLSKKIYRMNDRKGYCVLVPPDTAFSPEQLAVLKLKNVKLYTTRDAPLKLRKFCYKSGGGIDMPHFLKHNLWVFSFSYVKPITEEIIPISVVFKTPDMNYSDTVYVTKKVIELELK
ncbi:hypothetical protein [Thermotoga sp.]|uniref:hypothetical protein n=1 Tax=Thermotoga sp. TaxID=28240 RepID=UPI0025FEEF2E|nr:hypothetical protein [Thermotoga sp.]MCD6551723.1 hypothetical protein [Thermotoga sp.]